MQLPSHGFSRLFTPILCGLAVLATVCAPNGWSQATSSAVISGQVTDESNAAVIGAEVRVVDSATGGAQTTLTNETGRYVIVNVSPGTYVITVSKQGFAVYKIAAQKVDVGTS